MEKMKLFEEFVAEYSVSADHFGAAKTMGFGLKNINVILNKKADDISNVEGYTNDMFKNGSGLLIIWRNGKVQKEQIENDIVKASKKDRNLGNMSVTWNWDDEGDDLSLITTKGNYKGVIALFQAVDKHYGKSGGGIFWLDRNNGPLYKYKNSEQVV